jgi:hypothetical protein
MKSILMKSILMKSILMKYSILAASLLGAVVANGATITWGAANELKTASDLIAGVISTTGINGGYDAGVTVNGVTYQNYSGPDDYTQFTGQPAAITTTYTDEAIAFSKDQTDIYSLETGDPGLDTLLATHLYTMDNTAAITIQMNSLTIGANYRVQLVGIADNRGDYNTLWTSPDGGTTKLYRYADLGDADSDKNVLYSIGSFTANATTQSFTITGGGDIGGGGFSAMVIAQDTIPEPSAALLGSLGMLALLRRRR